MSTTTLDCVINLGIGARCKQMTATNIDQRRLYGQHASFGVADRILR